MADIVVCIDCWGDIVSCSVEHGQGGVRIGLHGMVYVHPVDEEEGLKCCWAVYSALDRALRLEVCYWWLVAYAKRLVPAFPQ